MDEIESVLKYTDVFQDSGQDGFELTASFSIILQFCPDVNTIFAVILSVAKNPTAESPDIFISSPKGCSPMTVL